MSQAFAQACASPRLQAREKSFDVNGALTIPYFGTCQTCECKRQQTISSPTSRHLVWGRFGRERAAIGLEMSLLRVFGRMLKPTASPFHSFPVLPLPVLLCW